MNAGYRQVGDHRPDYVRRRLDEALGVDLLDVASGYRAGIYFHRRRRSPRLAPRGGTGGEQNDGEDQENPETSSLVGSLIFRLAPGREVRLRCAYFLTCHEVIKDGSGEVVELRCTYDPATRGGDAPDGRRVKATLHWVSAAHALPAEVRIYDRLFTVEDPEREEGRPFTDYLNPASLEVLTACKVEPSLAAATVSSRFQFERLGYFCVDPDSTPGAIVFNRTVSLRDAWAKIEQRHS